MSVTHYKDQHDPSAITVGQAIRDLELLTKVMTLDELRNRIEFLPL